MQDRKGNRLKEIKAFSLNALAQNNFISRSNLLIEIPHEALSNNLCSLKYSWNS